MDVDSFNKELDRCIDHLKEELAQIRTGRATPELIEPVKVEAYGTISPLKNLANISVADTKSLVVQPWDKSVVDMIAKGIENANLGLSVISEGDKVRVILPDLSEERRKDLVKVMKERVETARISVRNVRREQMKELDEMIKEGSIGEDEGKRQQEQVEKLVKERNEQIEELRDNKEKDLMTV